MGSIEEGQRNNGKDCGNKGNKKKNNVTISREFRSEVLSETHQLVWNIEKFSALIAMSKDAKSAIVEGINFDAGESIGMGSKWRCEIRHGVVKEGEVNIVYDNDMIGVYISLLEYKGKADKLFGQTKLTIKDPVDGKVYRRVKEAIRERTVLKGQGWGWPKFAGISALKKDKILLNDTLTLYIDFTIFGNKRPLSLLTDDEVGKKKMRLQMKEEIIKGFGTLLENGLCADFVIKVPKGDDDGEDGEGEYRSFNVHKNVLATHSLVFRTMFQTSMKEKETGEMTVTDMSPKSMKLMLRFIYTGEVDEDWIQVAEEVIRAADKYELPLLKEFCDKNLHQVVTAANALDMLNLCKLYNLPHALKSVNDFIRINVLDFSSLLQ